MVLICFLWLTLELFVFSKSQLFMLLIDFILVPHFYFYFYYFHILASLLFSLKILGKELSSLVFLLSLFFLALIYTSLIINDDEYLFIFLLVICMSPSGKCLFSPLPIFKLGYGIFRTCTHCYIYIFIYACGGSLLLYMGFL